MPRKSLALLLTALIAVLLLAAPAHAAEDAGGATPQFKEGDVITMSEVDKLRPFLPEEFEGTNGERYSQGSLVGAVTLNGGVWTRPEWTDPPLIQILANSVAKTFSPNMISLIECNNASREMSLNR